MLSALPLLASLLTPTAEAGVFRTIRIDTKLKISSDEICNNGKDDDRDGLVDEAPCVTGDFSNPWDKLGGTAGPGGTSFIPWENWLVAMDSSDGTLSIYELYDVTQVGKSSYDYRFERVVSDLDTIGLASSASDVTVGTADLDQDGSEDLVLGFGDYGSGLGIMVGYDLQSGYEQTAYDYSGYMFSPSTSLNIVDTALLDETNGRLLVDVGYADYYGTGFGWFKAVDSRSFASGVASDGQWALVDQAIGSVKYR
jgi:hypothetical protein